MIAGGEPKLEDRLRQAIRLKQYSPRTEETYVQWYRRYVLFHKKRSGRAIHPADMGAEEIGAFLTHLAVDCELAATSQNQALNALVFLYKQVLRLPVDEIAASRARHQKRLPVVLTSDEVTQLLQGVRGDAGLAIKLLYACGLRVAEVQALRVKDVDLGGNKLEVRGGKGDKDRVITLPRSLQQPLREHLARVKA